MREVEKVKTALSQLWDCERPSYTWQKLKRRELESNARKKTLWRVDVPPIGNTVKKYSLPDLVVDRAFEAGYRVASAFFNN